MVQKIRHYTNIQMSTNYTNNTNELISIIRIIRTISILVSSICMNKNRPRGLVGGKRGGSANCDCDGKEKNPSAKCVQPNHGDQESWCTAAGFEPTTNSLC